MSALTNVQIIEHGRHPAFAVIPYDDFLALTRERINDKTIPHRMRW